MKRIAQAVSIIVLSLSCTLAWTFGYSLGAGDIERYTLASFSVTLELWKVMLPFVIAEAWRQKRTMVVVLATPALPLLISYSFAASLGFSEMNRGAVSGTRDAAAEQAGSLRSDIRSLRAERDALATARPLPEIDADIAEMEQRSFRVNGEMKSLLAATATCTEVGKRNAADCARWSSLKGERARAAERQRLTAVIEGKEEALGMAGGLALAGLGDPQIAALKDMTGSDAKNVRRTLGLVFAALVEVIGGFGLFFASALGGDARKTEGTDANAPPPPDDGADDEDALARRYLSDRVEPRPGAKIVASAMHRDYSVWVTAQGKAPMTLTSFGNFVARHGIAKERSEGRIFYQDVALASHGAGTR